VLDAGPIAGANSALLMDYLLKDDSAATRAAASVLGAYFNQPFYTELRTRQQLGYIVGSSASGSLRDRYFTFIVQSSDYGPAELRRRAEAFIATLPASMAKISDEEWATLIAGARANLEQKPKSIAEKAEILFTLAYDYDAEWGRRQAALAELNVLTKAKAVEMLTEVLTGQSTQRRTVMLTSAKHAQETDSAASFSDRAAWKSMRQFQ
jgi:insulysin